MNLSNSPSRLLFQKKLLRFQTSFHKIRLSQKLKKIRSCCRSLKTFCRENHALCQIRYPSETASRPSVSIRILSSSVLITDETPKVQWLFQHANLIEISPCHGLILTELWFRCWKLEPAGIPSPEQTKPLQRQQKKP